MTPQQKIRHSIILRGILLYGIAGFPVDEINAQTVDDLYDRFEEEYSAAEQDARSEIRDGEVDTDLPSPCSRHYESKSVASKMPDGSWVGWTYWYGGGKHGEPESIDWIDDAYDLDMTEEEVTITRQNFKKKENK